VVHRRVTDAQHGSGSPAGKAFGRVESGQAQAILLNAPRSWSTCGHLHLRVVHAKGGWPASLSCQASGAHAAGSTRAHGSPRTARGPRKARFAGGRLSLAAAGARKCGLPPAARVRASRLRPSRRPDFRTHWATRSAVRTQGGENEPPFPRASHSGDSRQGPRRIAPDAMPASAPRSAPPARRHNAPRVVLASRGTCQKVRLKASAQSVFVKTREVREWVRTKPNKMPLPEL
jgi:hypothetical protein